MKTEYCKLAKRKYKRNIVCGSKCPDIGNCAMLILEDAIDEAIPRALDALGKNNEEVKDA